MMPSALRRSGPAAGNLFDLEVLAIMCWGIRFGRVHGVMGVAAR